MTMRPMSLYESGDSSGDVSLKDLFDGVSEIGGRSEIGIDRLAFLVCRGGWPQSVCMRDDEAVDQARDYYESVVRYDINRATACRNIRTWSVPLCVPLPEIRAGLFRIQCLRMT